MEMVSMARVSKELMSIGVPPGMNGYMYLKDAVSLVYSDPLLITKVTKELYPKVAELNSTKPNRVERSIRAAIERTFDSHAASASEYFGNIVDKDKGKVTNTTFIATIVERLRMGE